MTRHIQALIHVDALAHNLSRARQAAPDAKVWAVVKANAYGHRLSMAYEGLRGADGFALLDFEEAQRLREMGWRGPILMLEGCFEARDLELCSRWGLWHVVHRQDQIDWLAGHKTTWPHHVYLKLNSGMNRLGFAPEAYRSAWLRLSGLTQVESISHMTHFSDADVDGGMDAQQAVFDRATAGLPGERSLANSAATLRHGHQEAVRADWIRPGVMLYGASPDHPSGCAGGWGLAPAMSLQSRIIGLQHLKAGDTVGYGSIFRAPGPMRIGVVACGYADGYPRVVSSDACVLVAGRRCAIVGRVSMDMITVDVSQVPEAHVGTAVTLWGRGDDGAVLPIDEVAATAGTLGYELMCALSLRVPTVRQSDQESA